MNRELLDVAPLWILFLSAFVLAWLASGRRLPAGPVAARPHLG